MSDDTIIELLWNRNESGLGETRVKYGAYCHYISKNIIGSDEDAEECVNETLLAVWNSIPPHRPNNYKTYIGKIIRNITISKWRENHSCKRFPSEYSVALEEMKEIATDDDFRQDVDAEILSHALSDFLRIVSETERNLMIRRYWFNDSIQSICNRYSFTESKVKVTLKRTRDKLKKYLKERGYTLYE